MAKKTIKAQMKQRRDTKANWEATNPVLLDGELGIVSDDPNLYKVGDGATAWNSLPFRGFDGTLAQELGTSPNAVISQKVVSEKLTELESKVGRYVGTYIGDVVIFDKNEVPVGMSINIKLTLRTSAGAIVVLDANGKELDRIGATNPSKGEVIVVNDYILPSRYDRVANLGGYSGSAGLDVDIEVLGVENAKLKQEIKEAYIQIEDLSEEIADTGMVVWADTSQEIQYGALTLFDVVPSLPSGKYIIDIDFDIAGANAEKIYVYYGQGYDSFAIEKRGKGHEKIVVDTKQHIIRLAVEVSALSGNAGGYINLAIKIPVNDAFLRVSEDLAIKDSELGIYMGRVALDYARVGIFPLPLSKGTIIVNKGDGTLIFGSDSSFSSGRLDIASGQKGILSFDAGYCSTTKAGIVFAYINSPITQIDANKEELERLNEVNKILSEELNDFKTILTSVNLIDPTSVAYGEYVYTGKLHSNPDYNTTGFVPVKSGNTYALVATGGQTEANARFISFFDAGKKWVSDGANNLKEITIPDGVSYIRVSYQTIYWDVAQINLGDAIPFQEYAEMINPSLIKDMDFSKVNTISSFRNFQELAPSSIIELPLNYVSRNVEISAVINGNIESVEIGLGKEGLGGGYIELTKTSINIYVGSTKLSTLEHGLTLSDKVYVSIRTADAPNAAGNKSAEIILRSNGDIYKTTLYFATRGSAFVKNNGSNSIDAGISFFPCNAAAPIWMFGDSYFEWADNTRWITQSILDGNKNFMESALSGGQSDGAMTSFANLLKLGLPKIAVWCMGMNDGNDSADAPSSRWLSHIKTFLAVCERGSITPVLATIPTVPTVNNEKKNEWVRNSGYRYIDFASAVGATSSGQWDEGLLSADGVHPSEKGGIMLYAQALVDLPEIANS